MSTEDDVARNGILTARFDEALIYALAAHDTQTRKGTEIPYAAHLLGVSSLVLEAGGSETEAIAALLHDVVEDQGGADRLADVRARFGDEIAAIVEECSAEEKTDDPGWRVRKERYIAQLAASSESALLVSLADKHYNARAILDDYRALGDRLWPRFGAPEPKADNIRWYYHALIDAYSLRLAGEPHRLLAELGRTVRQLDALVSRPNCPSCHAGDVTPVIIGMPFEGEYDVALEAGIEMTGCCVDADTPDYRCRVCGFGWLRDGRMRR
jgi:hypothetical protein